MNPPSIYALYTKSEIGEQSVKGFAKNSFQPKDATHIRKSTAFCFLYIHEHNYILMPKITFSFVNNQNV